LEFSISLNPNASDVAIAALSSIPTPFVMRFAAVATLTAGSDSRYDGISTFSSVSMFVTLGASAAPLAHAGVNQVLTYGTAPVTVFLNGSSSCNAADASATDPLAFQWTVISKTASTPGVIATPSLSITAVTALTPGKCGPCCAVIHSSAVSPCLPPMVFVASPFLCLCTLSRTLFFYIILQIAECVIVSSMCDTFRQTRV
jgi:hypothetical protein